MILAPLAVILLATAQPETVTLLQKQNASPAVIATTHGSLREAVIDAARHSAPRLEQAPILKRGGPRRLSGGAGKRAVAIGLGVVAGFVGGLVIGPAASNGECMSPLWLVMSTSVAGGAVGWALTRD